MTQKKKRGRFVSNYDEATVHLLSAFFSITGKASEDRRLRSAIERLLRDLARVQGAPVPSNVIPFRPKPMFAAE